MTRNRRVSPAEMEIEAADAFAEAAADAAPMDEVMADFRRVLRRHRRAEEQAIEEAAAHDDPPNEEVMAGFRAAMSAVDIESPEERSAANTVWWATRPRTNAEPRPEPNRGHRYLDEWLIARPGPLADLVNELVPAIDAIEGADRLRRRKAADEARLKDRCAVVLANLAWAWLEPAETGRVALALAHRRERRPRTCNDSFGDTTKATLEAMSALGIIEDVHLPEARRGEASSFAASPELRAEFTDRGVTLDDLGRHPREWPIKLGRQQPRGSRERRPPPRPVAYADTPATDAMAAQLRRINAFLGAARIEFIDDGLGRVDALDRQLRRTFLLLEDDDDTPRFDRGGRLSGGFWMALKSGRRSSLRIDGEPVADLDFQSMFMRLAYARAGVAAPAGDLYALPGLAGYRSGAKRGFSALLFRKRLPVAWGPWMALGRGPDGTERPVSDADADALAGDEDIEDKIEGRLPDGWSPKQYRATLFHHHPALAKVMRPGLGYELMVDESRVLLDLLERLMAKGIVALPMHDGTLVSRSNMAQAREAMSASARAVTGYDIPVVEKGL